MRRFNAIYRKEMAAIFYSPVAYAVIAVFALLMSYTFCAQLFHTRSSSLIAMLYQAAMLMLLTVPLITMRQFAEERSNRTLELLLSTPISEMTIVAGKFFASMSLVVVLLGVMLCYPAALSLVADPDWGSVFSGYAGLLLLGCALIALGLAISALTSNQVIAAILTLGLFLVLWMAEVLGVYLPSPFDDVAVALSLDTRLSPFAAGLIYLSDIGYFVLLTLLGCFFAAAALGRR